MNVILTVDPGVYTMGACLWWEDGFTSTKFSLPFRVVNYNLKSADRRALQPNDAMAWLVGKLRIYYFEKYPVISCYCEKPAIFTSARGMAGAIKGHVLQLEMFRGMLFSLCQEFNTLFVDVPALTWKGQLPKKLTVDRIKTLISEQRRNVDCLRMSANGENDWDALGIGLHIQGFFK